MTSSIKNNKNIFAPIDPSDPGYMRNKLLPSQLYNYTQMEVAELERCRDDICYFAEKYFTIVSVDFGKIRIPLYDYQKILLHQLQKERFNIVLQSRQSGKCLSINTKVTVRNKISGETKQLTIGEFHEQFTEKRNTVLDQQKS